MIHDGKNLVEGVGAEEGDTGLAEVGQSFEDGRGGEMTTGMDDAFALITTAPSDRCKDVLLEDGDFFFHRPRQSRC